MLLNVKAEANSQIGSEELLEELTLAMDGGKDWKEGVCQSAHTPGTPSRIWRTWFKIYIKD